MSTVENAEKKLETARTTVRQWEEKARDARSEAAMLDADSGAAILADPTAARDIAVRINESDLQARAYDGAAKEARERVKAARRELLEAWTAHYDKEAEKAKDAIDAHQAKLDVHLAKLKELDGWEFERKEFTPQVGDSYTPSVGAELARTHRNAVNSAAYIRYYMGTGSTPQMALDLRNYGGVGGFGVPMYEVLDDQPAVVAEDIAETFREKHADAIPVAAPRDPDRPLFITDKAA